MKKAFGIFTAALTAVTFALFMMLTTNRPDLVSIHFASAALSFLASLTTMAIATDVF